jgi:hypothetical protein
VKPDYLTIVLLAFLPLFVRVILYLAILKFRSIRIRPLSLIVVAGSPYLVGFIPLPLPSPIREMLAYLLSVFLAMFLLTRYTEAELFPDVVVIPVVVELSSKLLLEWVLIPLLA